MFIRLADLSKKNVESTKSLSEIKSVLQYALTHSDSDKMLIDIFVEKVICFENNEYEVILNPLCLDLKSRDTIGAREGT